METFLSSDSTSSRKGHDTGWLLTEDGKVLASLTSPTSTRSAMRGLMFTDPTDTAIYFGRGSMIHTFGVSFELDVAVLSRDSQVARTLRLKPNRVAFTGYKHGGIIEAEAGSFERWGLTIGQQLNIDL